MKKRSVCLIAIFLVVGCGGSSSSSDDSSLIPNNTPPSPSSSDIGAEFEIPELILLDVPSQVLQDRATEPEPMTSLYVNEYPAFGQTKIDMRTEIQYLNTELGTVKTDSLFVKTTRTASDDLLVDSIDINSSASGTNYSNTMKLDEETQRISQIIVDTPNVSELERGKSYMKVDYSYSSLSDAVSLCYVDYNNNILGSVRFSSNQISVFQQNAVGYCQDANDSNLIERTVTDQVLVDQFNVMVAINSYINIRSESQLRIAGDFDPLNTSELLRRLGLILTSQGAVGSYLVFAGYFIGSYTGVGLLAVGVYVAYDAIYGIKNAADAIEDGVFQVSYDDRVYCRNNGLVPPCTTNL